MYQNNIRTNLVISKMALQTILDSIDNPEEVLRCGTYVPVWGYENYLDDMKKNDTELSKKVKNPTKFLEESKRRIEHLRALNEEHKVETPDRPVGDTISLDPRMEDLLNIYFFNGKKPPVKLFLEVLHASGYSDDILKKAESTERDTALDDLFSKYACNTKTVKPKKKTLAEKIYKIKDNYMNIDVEE